MANSARQARLSVNLTPDEQRLLRTLATQGPCNQKALRAATGLGRWKAHTLLLRLETLGLVTWREHGRSKDYMLTPVAAELPITDKEEVGRAEPHHRS